MFKTVESNEEADITEKKSKFIANIFYITSEEEAEEKIRQIKRKHNTARHHCYAYRIIRKNEIINKSSDDGEPSGTAGMPMLNILEKNNFKGNLVLAFDNDKSGKMYQDIVKEELTKIKVNSFSTSIIASIDVKDLNEALIKNKESLIRNYNYFNDNFNIIIDKNIKEKENDLEL